MKRGNVTSCELRSRRSFLKLSALGVGSMMSMSAGDATSAGDKIAEPSKLASAAELLRRREPLLIAHRGLPGVAPENSLPGFEAALGYKPDFVELDYRHSIDGVPIVIHDDKLDRTTNSRIVFGREGVLIGEKSSAELRALDAGSWYGPKFAGARLPSLGDAIDLVCPQACLMIERKDGDAATLVKLLHEKKVLDRVIVQAFDWSFIADVRKLEPNLATGLLGKDAIDAESLAKILAIGPRVIGWDYRTLDAVGIRTAHDAGVKVWSWTVNDPDRARELVAAGLDGLITNRADVARDWLDAK